MPETAYSERSDQAGVCVADGWGVRLSVRGGSLIVEDGTGEDRRRRTYPRVGHGLTRVILRNPGSGSMSFEALRWLRVLGIPLVGLTQEGPVLIESPRTIDDARLRRAQALAIAGEAGLAIAKTLLGAKLRGQAGLLASRFGELSEAEAIERLGRQLAAADDLDACRWAEAEAASIYWGAWVGRPDTQIWWDGRDARRIPEHWRGYGSRRSAISGGNWKASHPVNALLNYAFRVLEGEAALALLAVGLDPGMGVVHTDDRKRDSMALDLVEPVRPQVEAWVLELLQTHRMAKSDFIEASSGTVTLTGPVAHELASWAPRMAQELAPYAEATRDILAGATGYKVQLSTPLTQARRKASAAAPVSPTRRKHAGGRPRSETSYRAIAERLGITQAKARRMFGPPPPAPATSRSSTPQATPLAQLP